jgi:hypothetical protein
LSLTLDPPARARILDFVRPLTVSLDGMTNFGYVERRLAVAERLLEVTRGGDPKAAVDEGRLFLLAAFATLPERRIAAGGRTELLLKSVGLPLEEIAFLFHSLRRFESDPQTLEEKLVRDAALFETVGAYGITQLLVASTRERMTLAEMAAEIEAKMKATSFSTLAARVLAAGRIEFARSFAKRLAEEIAEFEEVAPLP